MTSKRPRRERRLRIREERKPVDTKKLASALIALAQAQAEAEAETEQAKRTQQPGDDA